MAVLRAIAFKGREVGIHHLLGLNDGARAVRVRKGNEGAYRFVYMVHTTRSAAWRRTVPICKPRRSSARLKHRLKHSLVPRN